MKILCKLDIQAIQSHQRSIAVSGQATKD